MSKEALKNKKVCGWDMEHRWKLVKTREDDDCGFMMPTVFSTWKCARCKVSETVVGRDKPHSLL